MCIFTKLICMFITLDTGGNWSMVGSEAEAHLKEPTMQLNLVGHSPELQESLVIHSFGHALGLEHEHQRTDFWEVLGKYLDVGKMKADPFVGSAFETAWAEGAKEKSVNSLLEYDPESIMHYRFVVVVVVVVVVLLE